MIFDACFFAEPLQLIEMMRILHSNIFLMEKSLKSKIKFSFSSSNRVPQLFLNLWITFRRSNDICQLLNWRALAISFTVLTKTVGADMQTKLGAFQVGDQAIFY